MIEELKKNIETEISMLREISSYYGRVEFANENEKKLLGGAIESLIQSIKLINNSVPNILKNVQSASKLPSSENGRKNAPLENIQIKRKGGEIEVTVHRKDRERLLRELSINEGLLKKLKRKKSEEESEVYAEFKSARGYLKLSNRFFQNTSVDLINKGYFKGLDGEIRRANIDILYETYVSMILFTTLLSIFAGIFLLVFLLFFSIGLTFPFVSVYSESYLTRIVQIFWIPLVVPVITFVSIYFYPNMEKGSIEKKIDQELPFAVIHMGAISGSGISPVEIFRIIGLSREYPALKKEIRKVLNKINLYGYDLVTALTNTAVDTPSNRLKELFLGLATTISSGGGLKEFFENRGESLLTGYRLEREKYSKVAETFMDIYISVVIAAPMILMLLLIMLSISSIGIGLTPGQITMLIILVISLINVVFLVFLHIRQPAY